MTSEEAKLGDTYEARRASLEDKTRFRWDDDLHLYVSLENPAVKFDTDGEQIIQAEADNDFKDVRMRVLSERYGLFRAKEILDSERKGGK